MDKGFSIPCGDAALPEEENDIILLSEEEADETAAMSGVSLMQAAVCIAVVAALFAAIHLVPDTGRELISLLHKLTSEPEERFLNPIGMLSDRFGIPH